LANTSTKHRPRSCLVENHRKSQLQTVLITASGPQALNALVHRERYTQGSRQNRCVSSQEALALRAKAVGNGRASGGKHSAIHRTLSSGQLVGTALVTRDSSYVYPFRGGLKNRLPYATRAAPVHSRRSTKLPTQNCLRRGIQLYN